MLQFNQINDINKLHSVLNLLNNPTQTTEFKKIRTMAYISLMLGEVYLGDSGNQYLCITNPTDLQSSVLQFIEVLQQEQYSVSIIDDNIITIPSHEQTYVYCSVENIESSIKGRMFNKVFINVDDCLQEQFSELIKLAKCRELS